MKEITVQKLKEMLDKQNDIQLIDVREGYEHEIADIGGDKIPMGTVPEHIAQINRFATSWSRVMALPTSTT